MYIYMYMYTLFTTRRSTSRSQVTSRLFSFFLKEKRKTTGAVVKTVRWRYIVWENERSIRISGISVDIFDILSGHCFFLGGLFLFLFFFYYRTRFWVCVLKRNNIILDVWKTFPTKCFEKSKQLRKILLCVFSSWSKVLETKREPELLGSVAAVGR